MVTTSDLKNGMVLNLEGQLWQVAEPQHVKPGEGLAFVCTKIKSALPGKTVDKTSNAGLKVETATVDRRDMQYFYKDGNNYVFMDVKPYKQTCVPSATAGETVTFIPENQEIIVASHEDLMLLVELSASVVLAISHTEPDLQGDRSSAGTKPVTVETSAEIQVPLFLSTGDKVEVDTRSGSYISCVND